MPRIRPTKPIEMSDEEIDRRLKEIEEEYLKEEADYELGRDKSSPDWGIPINIYRRLTTEKNLLLGEKYRREKARIDYERNPPKG